MPFYPRFWPGCDGVMVAHAIDWKSVQCRHCGQSYTICCRPTAYDDARRICQCGHLSILNPVKINGTEPPYQAVTYVKLPRWIRLLPRNWQATLLRAAYCASPSELRRLERKSGRMLRRLERLTERAQAGNESAQAKGKRLYQRYQRLQATRHIYRAP